MPLSANNNKSKTIILAAAAASSVALVVVMSSRFLQRGIVNDRESETNSKTTKESGSISNTSTSNIVFETIKNRRSIFPKQYAARKWVSKEILYEMLEAAKYAPTHKLTQPWYFVVHESLESRRQLGELLANHYKEQCTKKGDEFKPKKYEKKLRNCLHSSFVIAICVNRSGKKDVVPEVEDICAVACAVQNMHLVATHHNVGAYWSSGAIYDKTLEKDDECSVTNPAKVREFLQLPTPNSFCLGWFFVGYYEGKFYSGKRDPMDETKVCWR